MSNAKAYYPGWWLYPFQHFPRHRAQVAEPKLWPSRDANEGNYREHSSGYPACSVRSVFAQFLSSAIRGCSRQMNMIHHVYSAILRSDFLVKLCSKTVFSPWASAYFKLGLSLAAPSNFTLEVDAWELIAMNCNKPRKKDKLSDGAADDKMAAARFTMVCACSELIRCSGSDFHSCLEL